MDNWGCILVTSRVGAHLVTWGVVFIRSSPQKIGHCATSIRVPMMYLKVKIDGTDTKR